MRPYPVNSPKAVARILALGMLIDGVADEAEYALIEQDDCLQALGIDSAQVDVVIREFYEDLELGGSMTRTLDQRLTAGDLSRVLAEVTYPFLQQTLLRGMMKIAVANDELSTGEARLIREALVQWTSDEGVGSLPIPANQPCRRESDRALKLS
ncbi:hypothetical protein BJN45_00825 [Azonexus hydrophilus]|uniref:Co-chaperone DjlA N-terminal domain-containing protein n=1 Tax=Azonexus hydrophilus TaxID=418702 RepID=A0A1R1IC33_9RHOO|nr:hypothetical protein [Azonexus hydrophilus]OMG56210.1 hypothetical protein BJN45_00825 [Azonexus hydrophilus]